MNGKSSFNISGSVPQSIWILDSGTIDHMTPFPSHFISYLKVPKRQLITVVNGDHVPIVGSDNVQLHSSLSLNNVLYVPKLANNLISIHRLIQDWNCVELTTGRTIGVAKEQGGLYYLQHTKIGSDNGTEFVNLEFSKFLKDNGVVHELTCVNTPQQNGVAERKNRHLLEVARALLFQMYVPNVYWGEVVLTAAYLINRLPTRVLNGISPIKHMLSFFPSSPLILSLPSRVFGCVTFVHSHNPHCEELDPKAIKCVFIRYPSNEKGFKCYHPSSRRFFVSIDVTFHETQSFFVGPPLQGESYLEVEPVIESLPFPTQDVQVQVQEVTPTQDVQVQEVTKPTLVLEQVQMSELDVSIPDNSIEEQVQLSEPKVSVLDNSIEDVTNDMRIDHLFVQHQSFIAVIDAIKTPTLV
ncbi:hypothetical protein CR513_19755, partial [Mucuna pruriens]